MFASHFIGTVGIIVDGAVVNQLPVFIEQETFGGTIGTKGIGHCGIFVDDIAPGVAVLFTIVLHVVV